MSALFPETSTITSLAPPRRLPFGAELIGPGLAHFRVWAPAHAAVEVVLDSGGGRATVPLTLEGEGVFSGAAAAEAGTRYGYRLSGGLTVYPDPASRYQPDGPHGLSEVIDPAAFPWSDRDWAGVTPHGQVVYELHVGTFTPAGTWQAAREQLPRLADLGVTLIEVMPVAEFAGEFGWGYDGVDLFAPFHHYGRPDDFRAFVDAAHALGVGVILDVVYNHLGPDGNYLGQFAPAYFTDRYKTDWGAAINYDGPDAGPVREFFLSNAEYWVDEYHLDGLRLDATQNIYDQSDGEHVLAALSRRVRTRAGHRGVFLVAENEPQESRLVRPAGQGGLGLDAVWNDDFHHSARVALTGRAEAYYSDYRGTPQEFIAAAKYGYLYQGQFYRWQNQPRGTPGLDLPPWAFVTFLENHDQVANSARGLRGQQLTSPGRWRALTTLLLLGPGTPMLFQGQEYGETAPWYYFAHHGAPLAKLVARGRREFLEQFPGAKASPDLHVPDPADRATLRVCTLDPAGPVRGAEPLALHADLLTLRRREPAFRAPARVDGAVLGPEAFVLRFFAAGGGADQLLLVNLGADLDLASMPEPLLAPPPAARQGSRGGERPGGEWELRFSTEDVRYGGSGTPPLELSRLWKLPGQAAVVLRPARQEGER